MPRGKKTEDRAPPQTGVSKRVFLSFLHEIKDLKQTLSDANTKHAQEWKQADKLGINAHTAKMIARWDKMEEAKRLDELRSLFKYIPWMGWGVQGAMFDSKLTAALNPSSDDDDGESGAGGDQEGETEVAELPLQMIETRELPSAERALQEQEEREEPVDDAPAQHTEELANGGFTFAAGREAAERGEVADACPHPEGAPSHTLWMNGHARGLADKAAPETNVVPLDEGNKRGRGRRAPTEKPITEGSNAVH